MNYKRNGDIKPNRLSPSFLINFDLLCLPPICHLCTVSVKTGTKGKKKIYGRGQPLFSLARQNGEGGRGSGGVGKLAHVKEKQFDFI